MHTQSYWYIRCDLYCREIARAEDLPLVIFEAKDFFLLVNPMQNSLLQFACISSVIYSVIIVLSLNAQSVPNATV